MSPRVFAIPQNTGQEPGTEDLCGPSPHLVRPSRLWPHLVYEQDQTGLLDERAEGSGRLRGIHRDEHAEASLPLKASPGQSSEVWQARLDLHRVADGAMAPRDVAQESRFVTSLYVLGAAGL